MIGPQYSNAYAGMFGRPQQPPQQMQPQAPIAQAPPLQMGSQGGAPQSPAQPVSMPPWGGQPPIAAPIASQPLPVNGAPPQMMAPQGGPRQAMPGPNYLAQMMQRRPMNV